MPESERFFIVRIYGLSRHKTEQILDGFASILTKIRRKSSDKKHSSDYSRHSNYRVGAEVTAKNETIQKKRQT